ncbi:ABC transporter substrate-binding protein [Roseateles oligotrophus]|uniref:ABC transporter substrate-binding protein n=1 Tax=Roseateles oligotrophus TaxID=1769250 RepID=A0ABT2YFM0_9BURK|nr:ABC transporter substrate-binding protein [Roseateles oligotrophus]MCV2368841.1 ABC transporter substrate-binding protein [Roseateles oligotrophus]
MTRIEAELNNYARSLSGLALSLALLLSLGMTPAGAAEPLRLAVSMTPLSLPIFVAEQQGYFAEAGLRLRLQEVVGGHRAMQLLLEGQADLATASEAVLMFNSFKSPQFALLASFVSSGNDIKLVLRPNTGIKQVKDLFGKRIGTVLSTASHYMLDTTLLASGVDPKSVQIIHLQPEAMADLLKSGEVDAVAIWEPLPFKLLQSVPGSQILPTPGSYRLSFNLIAAKALAGQRDEELQKLLVALERAERFIALKPEQAQALLRERLKLDQAFVDWIWPSYHYRLSLDQWLLSSLEAEARWARQGGHIKGLEKGDASPNYLDLIFAKPLRKAATAAVNLID